jgi:hypothetical protein
MKCNFLNILYDDLLFFEDQRNGAKINESTLFIVYKWHDNLPSNSACFVIIRSYLEHNTNELVVNHFCFSRIYKTLPTPRACTRYVLGIGCNWRGDVSNIDKNLTVTGEIKIHEPNQKRNYRGMKWIFLNIFFDWAQEFKNIKRKVHNVKNIIAFYSLVLFLMYQYNTLCFIK